MSVYIDIKAVNCYIQTILVSPTYGTIMDTSKLRSKFSGMYAPLPLSAVSSTLTADASHTTKIVLPCSKFSRVRIGYLNPHSVEIVGATMLVAATDTLESDTAANLSLPIVDGVTITDVDSTAHANGWRTVTKNADPSLTLPSGTTYARGLFWSDWINVTSVDPNVGNEAILLVRAFIPGTAYDYKVASIADSDTTVSVSGTENNGWIIQSAFHSGATDNEPTTGTETLSDNHLPIVVEFETTDRIVTVMGAGDQNYECNASLANETKDIRTNWLFRACRSASGRGLYYSPVNFGMSSQVQATINNSVTAFLAASTAPSIVVTQGWSANDFGSLTTTAGKEVKEKTQFAEFTEMLSYLESSAITPVITTAAPYSAGSVYSDAARTKYNSYLRGIPPVYLTKLDVAELTGSTYGNPETWKDGYKYSTDLLTNAAVDVLATNLKAIFAEII